MDIKFTKVVLLKLKNDELLGVSNPCGYTTAVESLKEQVIRCCICAAAISSHCMISQVISQQL